MIPKGNQSEGRTLQRIMKALLIVAVIAITLGSLAAQDQEREKQSLESESDEQFAGFYGNRYWYPFGAYPPYPPFGYPRYPWPGYYFIPVPPAAASPPSDQK
ncbi:follicular dendritic cell secreted peptide isoform X2 [Vombatus ursinus]|uniref:follicular dendritic cell secreted peptide isoform X2 n=1 Tax=Vombatus ursinus TaxID=29139 RepID=UPI000FFD5A0A|nr:follicular dendritic cell secreted peptide isoform X2 [Vombatus ursinus]